MRRFLCTAVALALCAAGARAADRPPDSPAAAKTRQKLKEKITVDYKDTRLLDVAKDLKSQFDGKLGVKIDNDGGVSNNLTVTYSATDKPLDQILDEMFAKNQLGYVIVSDPKDRLDGWILIKKGRQRSYEEVKEAEPAKDKTAKEGDKAAKEDAAKDKAAAKDKGKTKPTKTTGKGPAKDKTAKEKPTKEPTDEDGDVQEQRAASKLKLVKMLYDEGISGKDDELVQKAKARLGDLIHDYPKTKAAEQARELLKKLEK